MIPMEFRLLTFLALLSVVVIGSNAALPAEKYWRSKWPTTPIPQDIQNLLQPDTGDNTFWDMGYRTILENTNDRREKYGKRYDKSYDKKYENSVEEATEDKREKYGKRYDKTYDKGYDKKYENSVKEATEDKREKYGKRYDKSYDKKYENSVKEATEDRREKYGKRYDKIYENGVQEDTEDAREKYGKRYDKIYENGVQEDTEDAREKYGKRYDKIYENGVQEDIEDAREKYGKRYDMIYENGVQEDIEDAREKYGKRYDKIYENGVQEDTEDAREKYGKRYDKIYENGVKEDTEDGREKYGKRYDKKYENAFAREISSRKFIYEKHHHSHFDKLKLPNTTIFFVIDDLHAGKKMITHITKSTNKARILPQQVADTLPFSTDKLSEILQRFSVEATSPQGKLMKQTIEDCESSGIEGEDRYCPRSMESIVDFGFKHVGYNAEVLMNEVDKPKVPQEYTITDVKYAGANHVVCHKQKYPYAVYYCHALIGTKVYKTELLGADGTKAKAVAVCHSDTSNWNPGHLAFLLLNMKPGEGTVCHFIRSDTFVIVSKAEVKTSTETHLLATA